MCLVFWNMSDIFSGFWNLRPGDTDKRWRGKGNVFACAFCDVVYRAALAIVFVHVVEEHSHQVAGLVVVFQRAIAIWIRIKNTACGQGKNASGFRAVSTCVPRGEKLVARILKSGPLILKSEPLIFSLLRGVCNRLKKSSRLRGGECVFLLPVCGVPRGGSFIKHETVIRFCQIARLCPADSFTHGWRRSGLRRNRAGRQVTAEVRKLAKWRQLTLLFNFLMAVSG